MQNKLVHSDELTLLGGIEQQQLIGGYDDSLTPVQIDSFRPYPIKFPPIKFPPIKLPLPLPIDPILL